MCRSPRWMYSKYVECAVATISFILWVVVAPARPIQLPIHVQMSLQTYIHWRTHTHIAYNWPVPKNQEQRVQCPYIQRCTMRWFENSYIFIYIILIVDKEHDETCILFYFEIWINTKSNDSGHCLNHVSLANARSHILKRSLKRINV